MPYAIPQAQLYGARGRMADGAPIRNRGGEQFNTTSGNPGLPIFNTQPSPQQGTQAYGGQPTQLAYNTNMAPNGSVSNAQLAQGDIQQGNTNNFQSGIMPMFSNWNGGRFVRGGSAGRMPPVQMQPSPRGGPQQQGGNGMMMWQGHQVTPQQYDQIQAINARTARMRQNSVVAPPVTLPIMTNS